MTIQFPLPIIAGSSILLLALVACSDDEPFEPLPISEALLAGELGGVPWATAMSERYELTDDITLVLVYQSAPTEPCQGLGPAILMKFPSAIGSHDLADLVPQVYSPLGLGGRASFDGRIEINAIGEESLSGGIVADFGEHGYIEGTFAVETSCGPFVERE